MVLKPQYQAPHHPLSQSEPLQIPFTKGPFRGLKAASKLAGIPGALPLIHGIDQDMHLLRRHIALRQQKDLLSRFRMGGHVHDQDRMAGESSLNEHISDLEVLDLRGLQFLGQGSGPGIRVDHDQVGLEILVGVVRFCGLGKADLVAGEFGAVTLPPFVPGAGITGGEVEADLVPFLLGKQVFRPEPHHCICALLQVTGTDIHVDDPVVRPLVALGLTVVEQDIRLAGFEGDVAEPIGEAIIRDLGADITSRRPDAAPDGLDLVVSLVPGVGLTGCVDVGRGQNRILFDVFSGIGRCGGVRRLSGIRVTGPEAGPQEK